VDTVVAAGCNFGSLHFPTVAPKPSHSGRRFF
jgi:hypothetical protein